MSLYPEDEIKNKDDWIRTEIKCIKCNKYCGFYFGEKLPIGADSFLKSFYCSLKCRQEDLDKK